MGRYPFCYTQHKKQLVIPTPACRLAWESPKQKEIATPVCALVRNDMLLFLAEQQYVKRKNERSNPL